MIPFLLYHLTDKTQISAEEEEKLDTLLTHSLIKNLFSLNLPLILSEEIFEYRRIKKWDS